MANKLHQITSIGRHMDINWLKWTFTGLCEAIQELRDKVTFLLGKIHRTVTFFNKFDGIYMPMPSFP